MNNKILVKLIVPDIEENYNIFIPVNKKIGNVIGLLNKSIKELTNGIYNGSNLTSLYNANTGEKYPINQLVRNTNIRNGTKIVIM